MASLDKQDCVLAGIAVAVALNCVLFFLGALHIILQKTKGTFILFLFFLISQTSFQKLLDRKMI